MFFVKVLEISMKLALFSVFFCTNYVCVVVCISTWMTQ